MLPPGVKKKFDDNPAWIQAMILAYGQVRRMEDSKETDERLTALMKVIAHVPPG